VKDDAIEALIRHGDEAAAETLIKRYYAPILRYCRRHCSDMGKAEDLTQETFLKLFAGIGSYQEKQQFKAYLYTIAHHLCIDESRKVLMYPLEQEDEPICEPKELRQVEDQMEIKEMLGTLSEEQREAILLRFGEELTYKEIAAVMRCSLRTAQSRVRGALKVLKNQHGRM
jgi:RNA polymerase sigma-70 factor (ECF subfamily)